MNTVIFRRAGWIPIYRYGKSNRVKRKLLQDQVTLVEALKYARCLESADQHATKVENQAPPDVTVKQEVYKITADRIREKSDTYSDSSDEESTCMLQAFNPIGPSENRPLKTVLISGVGITILLDSGATVSTMDEATFKRYAHGI